VIHRRILTSAKLPYEESAANTPTLIRARHVDRDGFAEYTQKPKDGRHFGRGLTLEIVHPPMTSDAHNLQRFIDAQHPIYGQVRDELQSGRKETHWMWFIFPQIKGLGLSATAQKYSIPNIKAQ
jgi:hypothetical protein